MNILVVDDSLAMRMIVIKTLREAGYDGHDIEQAEDGCGTRTGLSWPCRPTGLWCSWAGE